MAARQIVPLLVSKIQGRHSVYHEQAQGDRKALGELIAIHIGVSIA